MSEARQPLVRDRVEGASPAQAVNALTLDRSDDGVVTLTLRQPGRPVVVLDWALLRAIDSALDRVAQMDGLRGFVLASEGRVFIAGANLQEIMDLSDERLHEYLRFGQKVYGRIATLPCATVAAINGAALGGGLEIAMHCDHLIGAEPAPGTPEKPAKPYQVGLPEAGLCICPGWGGTNLLPARMDPGRAIEMTATGRTMTVLDAAKAGLIEELVMPDRLLPRAREIARTPKASARTTPICLAESARRSAALAALEHVRPSLPTTPSAAAVIVCVESGISRGWHAALDAERESLVRLRNSPEGRAAINQFFEKSGSNR